MKKERENALNEQEARLGAMMAQLQMEKAKEVKLVNNVFRMHVMMHATKSSRVENG